MLTIFGAHQQMCDGLSRRDFLRVGALGGGLTLADMLRLKAQGSTGASPKAVIMMCLSGGPSHMDMYDMKPDAPAEYRGEWKPIQTNVPGFDICEHMPLQAKVADKMALVRNMKFLQGGHTPPELLTGFVDSRKPDIGAAVSKLRRDASLMGELPPYVSLNIESYPSFLGTAYKPFAPKAETGGLGLARGLTMDRLEDRKVLMQAFDTLSRDLDDHRRNLAGADLFNTQALRMISTSKARDAFDIGKEPDKVEPPKVVPPKTVTRVYRSNFVDANLVGEALLKMFPQQLTVSGVSTQLTPRMGDRDTAAATGVSSGILKTDGQARPSKLLVVRGPEDIVDAAMEIAKEMDFERPQVGIAVTIHDISNDALKDLGLTWEYGKLQIEEQSPRGINFGSFSRVPFTAVGTIRALERSDKAKLLASPNVSVLDGESAFILIGNRINFPVLVGFSQANTPIFDKQEERVGIYLQVSASVSNDGQITLSLYPQVSTVTGFLEVNGASYPQISTREAQTTLRVKSGETIVMGGMLKDEELSSVEKVPLLSQIPILGELFTHRKKTKSSSQVIISITPAILESNP